MMHRFRMMAHVCAAMSVSGLAMTALSADFAMRSVSVSEWSDDPGTGALTSVTLEFGEANGKIGQLYIVSGAEDCGAGTNGWTRVMPIAKVTPETSVYRYALTAGDRAYPVLRFVLAFDEHYVEDGIFARYDAIDNGGPGVHVDSMETWKDLVGGFGDLIPHFSNNGAAQYFTSNAWVNTADNNYWETSRTPTFGPECTVEVCLSDVTGRMKSDCGGFVGNYHSMGNNYWIGSFGDWSVQGMAVYGAASIPDLGKTYGTAANVTDHTFSLRACGIDQTGYFYIDGGSPTTFNQGGCMASTVSFFVNMSYPALNQSCFASYHSVRFYSRALEPWEIAHNSAVDEIRFLGAASPAPSATDAVVLENTERGCAIGLGTLRADDDGTVEVAWMLESFGEGTTATTDLIWGDAVNGFCHTTRVDSVVGTMCTTNLTTLVPGRTWLVKVRAENDCGDVTESVVRTVDIPVAATYTNVRDVSWRALCDLDSGAVTGVCIHVAAGSASDLYAMYGAADGGNDIKAWDAIEKIVTLTESAEEFVWPIPAGWGTAVTRIRFVVGTPDGLGPDDYVQDGLVAEYDAVANGVDGAHTDDTSTWVDLKSGFGNLATRFSSPATQHFTSTAWVNESGNNYWETTSSPSFGPQCTIEVCVSDVRGKNSNDSGFVGNYGNDGNHYWIGIFSDSYVVEAMAVQGARSFSELQKNYGTAAGVGRHTFALRAEGVGANSQFFIDGDYYAQLTQSAGESRGNFFVNMSYAPNNQSTICSYHSVRFYDRTLTPEELAQNAAVDAARFFGEDAHATAVIYGVSDLLFWSDPVAPTLGNVSSADELWRGDGVVLHGALSGAGRGGAATVVCEVSRNGTFADAVVWPVTVDAVGGITCEVFTEDAQSVAAVRPGVPTSYRFRAVNTDTGKTDLSPVFTFTTAAAAVLGAVSVGGEQRQAVFQGSFETLGAGSNTVWLTVEGVTYPVGVFDRTTARDFSLAVPLSEFNRRVGFTFTCSNETSGAQARWVTTASGGVAAADKATYTWKADADGNWSGVWSDPAHWSDNKGGDAIGYPTSANNAVSFDSLPDGVPVTVTLDGSYGVAVVSATSAGYDLTLRTDVEGGVDLGCSQGGCALTAVRGRLTLDAVRFLPRARYAGGPQTSWTFADHQQLHLLNGALITLENVWFSGVSNVWRAVDCPYNEEYHLWGTVSYNGVDTKVILDNAHTFFSAVSYPAGAEKTSEIVLEGAGAELGHWGQGLNGGSRKGADVITFRIPRNGYASREGRGGLVDQLNYKATKVGQDSRTSTAFQGVDSKVTFRVDPDSPFYRTSSKKYRTFQLFMWNGPIAVENIVLVQPRHASDDTTTGMFFTDKDGNKVGAGETAYGIAVTLRPRTGFAVILR